MGKQKQLKLDFETSVIIGNGLAAMSQGVDDGACQDYFSR